MRASIVVAVLLLALLTTATVFANNCHTHPWPHANNTILPGQRLGVGQWLSTSTNYLILEASGDLVMYRGAYPSTSHRWWSTGTSGTDAVALTLNDDGHLDLVTSSGSVVWRATINGSAVAVLQDSCVFATYQAAPLTNLTWNSTAPRCITAHIIPHSHDDVGWLLTPERYYDGCFDPTGGVQNIIGSMVKALAANRSRTFVQVESYFFNRWWNNQNNATKDMCRQVVANEQFVFINGGWSMQDEACVHHESVISNMAIGAQLLKDLFHTNLTIGWHIDPFGHASTTPRIMAQMGFNGFFFWRTDYEQRNFMIQTQTLETMWNPSPSLGDQAHMFTSILYNDYCVGCRVFGQGGFPMCPSPFCCYNCEQSVQPGWSHYFEKVEASTRRQTHLHDVARMFGVESLPYDKLRASDMAPLYAEMIQQYAANFRTNQVLIPWGCDFEHIDAEASFQLMDEVLTAMNNNPSLGVQGFYSTPQTYLNAVQSLNYSWPQNDFDYFLDSDAGHAYWSGYFSSRAEFKRFERFLMNERSSVEIALSSMYRDDVPLQNSRIRVLQEALGIAQHHDSITGTERQHVRDRYQFLLTEGLYNASLTYHDVSESITGIGSEPCYLSNLSSCPMTDVLNTTGGQVSVYVFNSLAWARNEIITIPVPHSNVAAFINTSGVLTPIAAQVQPTWELTTSVDPTSPFSYALDFELLVSVPIPALGLVELVLENPSSSRPHLTHVVTPTPGASAIGTRQYTVYFSNVTGRIAGILNNRADDLIVTPISQNVLYYTPMGPYNGQAAGAYIFRPNVPNAVPVAYNETFAAVTLQGPVCSEVRQTISDHNSMYQTVRVCEGQDHVNLLSGIGPVDPGRSGVEVVMRIETDISSNGTWYTDSEGLELQQRLRNRHLNYPHVVTEPVASNFYPCNLFSVINGTDEKTGRNRSLAVIADYSRATTSLNDGELEFLMIRRLLFDDNRGVAQPLNENIRILSSSRLLVDEPDFIVSTRKQSVLHAHPPIVRFGARSTRAWNASAAPSLPQNVLLHTRQQLSSDVFLMRLQHIYAAGEGPLAVPVNVSLVTVLPVGSRLVEVFETDINAVMTLDDANRQRMQFQVCDRETGVSRLSPAKIQTSIVQQDNEVIVQLQPMDIRTFIIWAAPAQHSQLSS